MEEADHFIIRIQTPITLFLRHGVGEKPIRSRDAQESPER
jgi:hypothetical protein